eukprot:1159312-Pelagomonas_calceolata.AAC.1
MARMRAQPSLHVDSRKRGGAPEGTTFHDIEEEWVVDAHTGRGSWKPVPKPSRAAMAAARERSDDGDDGVDDDDNF